MKLLVFIILFTVLYLATGCAEIGIVRQKGAEAADYVLDASVRGTCNDSTIGAIRRRYGGSPEMLQRWAVFCFGEGMPFTVQCSDGTPSCASVTLPKEILHQ